MTHQKWQTLSCDFMTRLSEKIHAPKLKDQQSIAFLHTDAKHKHLHIYVNRILPNGHAIDDNHIGIHCFKVAEQMAIDRGWETARDKSKKNLKKSALEPEAQHILNATKKALALPSKTLKQFVEQLKSLQVDTALKYDTKGILRGVSFSYSDKRYKATIIDKSLTGNKIESTLVKTSRDKKNHLLI